MQKKIRIIKNILLKEHEKISKNNFEKLLEEIKTDGFIKNPIIVDKDTFIILDGHHRYNILKHLGYTYSPVYFVEYKDKNIKVYSRRKGDKIKKEDVINAGLTNKLFMPKTTKHTIPGRPMNLRLPLEMFA